jgi:hypothetical protein
MYSKRYKLITAVILLFLFTSPILMRFGVLCNYCIQYKHYTKVLCINKDQPDSNCKGKCQLSKDLKELDQVPKKPKLPNIFNEEIEIFFVFEIGNNLVFNYYLEYLSIKKNQIINKWILTKGIIVDKFIPPEIS